MPNAGPLQNGNIRNSSTDRIKSFKNNKKKHPELLKQIFNNSYNNNINNSNKLFK